MVLFALDSVPELAFFQPARKRGDFGDQVFLLVLVQDFLLLELGCEELCGVVLERVLAVTRGLGVEVGDVVLLYLLLLLLLVVAGVLVDGLAGDGLLVVGRDVLQADSVDCELQLLEGVHLLHARFGFKKKKVNFCFLI